jgi:hypothetical protein
MSGVLARRAVAAAGITAVVLSVSPLVGTAGAAGFGPSYDGSSFEYSNGSLTFAAADARPGTAVKKPSEILVKFSDAIKLVQGGNGNPLSPASDPRSAEAPKFVNTGTNAVLQGTAAVGADTTVLRVTPPADMPDGVYKLHVNVFEASACPDAGITDLAGYPSCTEFKDDVFGANGSAPFTFTLDTVAPVVSIDVLNGGQPLDVSAAKDLDVTGTASADTESMTLTVVSSGGGAPQALSVPTLTAHPGLPSTWTSAGNHLAFLPDGTLQFTALGTDAAGNKTQVTSTGARRTAVLAAHPTAPRSFSPRSSDAAIVFRWATPTSTGGDPITGYRFKALDKTAGNSAVTKEIACSSTCPTSYTFSGLVNGHDYAVAVAAVNHYGVGAFAVGTGHPKAATTLTVKRSDRKINRGQKVTIHGRLATTKTGTALRNVTLRVRPVYDNGKVGDLVKIKTDMFGVYSVTFKPARSVRYVVRWRGNTASLPAKGSTHVDVTR